MLTNGIRAHKFALLILITCLLCNPPSLKSVDPKSVDPPGKNLRSFFCHFYCDFMMFYALILSGKGKTDHSKNIPLARNTHSDLLEATGAQSLSICPEFQSVYTDLDMSLISICLKQTVHKVYLFQQALSFKVFTPKWSH